MIKKITLIIESLKLLYYYLLIKINNIFKLSILYQLIYYIIHATSSMLMKFFVITFKINNINNCWIKKFKKIKYLFT